MKILQITTSVLSILFILGTIQEGNAATIQPISPAALQDQLILARHDGKGHRHAHKRHGHHAHKGHWHGGHHHGHGGYWWGGPVRACGWDSFGHYYCPRR